MGTRFDKMHGLGNDFVILDARQQPVSMQSIFNASFGIYFPKFVGTIY